MLENAASLVSGTLGRESRVIRSLRPAYESFLDWSYKGRGMPWTINGVQYRIDPHHRHRLGREYDAPVAAFLREHIKSDWTCFDVGGNVGAYVLQLAQWTRPAGRVVAFEPNIEAAEVLRRHVAYNGISSRVRIVPAAVGRKAGSATFYAAGVDGMSRLSAPNVAIAKQVRPSEVPVVTIDEHILQSGETPEVLVVDVEGFEIQVLAGAKNLIGKKRDLLIVVEMHPNVWSSAETTTESALRVLDELDLTPIPLQEQPNPMADHGIVQLKQRERE
jgi:FkbM family methyltransferase